MTLLVENLTVSFPGDAGRLVVLEDVGFTIEPGRCLALVGESGSGKSMTALSLLGLVPRPGRLDSGRVVVDGVDLRSLSSEELRRARGSTLAMVFQEPMTALNPVVRVGDQVVEVITLRERLDRGTLRKRCVDAFRSVGIPDPEARFDAYPHQLSGGLKQRVIIAMALVAEPKVLILDEPTTALDVTIQAQILALLRELKGRLDTRILLITHDLGVVNQLADDVAVLYAGRVVERGTREKLLGAPEHPYTEGLLRALPSSGTRGQRLFEIPGTVPLPSAWPSGCRFRTRCGLAIERCAADAPPERSTATGGRLSCFVRGGE